MPSFLVKVVKGQFAPTSLLLSRHKRLKSTNLGYVLPLAFLCVTLIFPTAVRADTVSLTAAFTNFTGTVFGGGVTFMSYCGASACFIPGGSPPPVICPDAGCSDTNRQGDIATNFSLGDPQHDRNSSVEFWTLGNVHNDLTFTVNQGAHAVQFDMGDPTGVFPLGTLTFTNGSWISNAKFGFEIQAFDASAGTFHGLHTFTGFVNLGLTAPPAGSSPAENADYIYFTDENGDPVVSPISLDSLPSMRVYEIFDAPPGLSNVGKVELWGKFGSLDLTSLQDPTGGAFLDPSLGPIPSGNPTATPEPGSLALLGTGLCLVWRTRRNQGLLT